MAKKTRMLVAAVVAFGLLLEGGALAADEFAIPRSVIGGGGQRGVSSGYILNGTVGEPIASDFSLGAIYGSSSGFWWSGEGESEYRIYLPLVLKG